MARGNCRRSVPALALVAIASLLLPSAAAAAPVREVAAGRAGHRCGRRRTPHPPRPPRVRPVRARPFGDQRPRCTGRLFIVEQTGTDPDLKRRRGPRDAVPRSSEPGQHCGGEQGLLGLAFHPGFKTNRKLVRRTSRTSTATRSSASTRRRRRTRTSSTPAAPHDPARSTSRTPTTTAGMLAFGPDGYLYIGMGDGGCGGDPGNRAQNTDTLLGKILRIDVERVDRRRRHYAIPSTNPYVGDRRPRRDLAARPAQPVALLVRPGERQPVDRRRRPGALGGDRPRGQDLDRRRPGRQLGLARPRGHRTATARRPGAARPARRCRSLEYDHSNGRCAVTGGYVYRGTRDPGARRRLRLRRLLQRRDLGRRQRRQRRRPPKRCSSTRPADLRVRREHGRRAVRARPRQRPLYAILRLSHQRPAVTRLLAARPRDDALATRSIEARPSPRRPGADRPATRVACSAHSSSGNCGCGACRCGSHGWSVHRRAGCRPRPGEGDPLASLARAIVFQQLAGSRRRGDPRPLRRGDRRRGDGGSDPRDDAEPLRAAGLSTAKTRVAPWISPRRSATAASRSTSLDAARGRRDRRAARDRSRHRPLDRRDVPALRARAAGRLAGRRPRACATAGG